MEKKLLEVIKQNLPETVAGEMKEFIQRAEQTIEELREANKTISGLEQNNVDFKKAIVFKDEKNSGLNDEITQLNDQIKMCEDCKVRYMQLGYQEKMMDIQNNHSVERVNDAKEFVSLAFKSPVFKKEVSATKGKLVKCADYADCSINQVVSGGEMIQDHQETETTTETEE